MTLKDSAIETQESQLSNSSTAESVPFQLVDGINKCSNAEYHADRKYKSSSVLKTALNSLEEYHRRYILGEPKPISNQGALDEGTLVHTALLEPELYNDSFVLFDGWKKAGKEYDAFLSNLSAGDTRIVISAPQKHRIEKLVKLAKSHLTYTSMLAGGEAEQTICGILHDIPIKVRFDYINVKKGFIFDVKTTGYSGDVEVFKLTTKDLSYDLSAALYLSMAEIYYGKPFEFYFGVLSKRDETANVYKLSQKTRLEGARKVLDACLKLKKAQETGIWTETAVEETAELGTSEYEILEV